jgi:hypothetical protein
MTIAKSVADQSEKGPNDVTRRERKQRHRLEEIMMKSRHPLISVVLVGLASIAASGTAVEAQVSKQDQA